jgi:hypothetical protein
VCVSDGDTTAGHDRETGAQRWRLIGAANGYPLPGGRMVLDDGGGARRILIDGATGRRLADLGSAMPVWDSLGRGTPYLMARTTQPAGLTSVSTLDPRSGRVRLRGAIPAIVDYACQNEGDLLACVTQDNRLAVTDVG